MSDVRYVVFSDLHFGAENSLLTNLVEETSETNTLKPGLVLTKMVECLRDVISKNKGGKKPTLILNGDVIELALTTTNNAAMAFERFIEAMMTADGEFMFDDEILFVAGNHDHNIWEMARNSYFINYLGSSKSGQLIEDETHTTAMFNPEPVPVTFFNALFRRFDNLKNVNVTAAYPAHALLSEDKERCVVICHGHYVESMYSLMTNLRSRIFPDRPAPEYFEELEAENFAWIDFFFSTLGRSGSVGKDINLIYDKIQDPKQVELLMRNIALSMTNKAQAESHQKTETDILHLILSATLGKLASGERNEPEVILTPDATKGLKRFMESFVLNHIKKELNDHVPAEVSFVFGHTHKPFEELMKFEGYKEPVKVYNGGGWVVDTTKSQPLHGGSIILIDDHLDVVSLQMYKEGKREVCTSELKDNHNHICDFNEQINGSINMKAEPWSGFASVVASEIEMRYRNLEATIQSKV